MQERTWQFRLDDANVNDCASYFEKRASEVASALNCRVVASSVVEIENLRGNVRKIIGTALLESVNVGSISQQRRGGRVPQKRLGRGQ